MKKQKLTRITQAFTLLIFILLLLISVHALSSIDPTPSQYDYNQNYLFSLNIDELNNGVFFKLTKDKIIILEKEKVEYDETKNAYLVNIDDLDAGNYTYLWQHYEIINDTNTNSTNITTMNFLNMTINESFIIEKAEPNLQLYVNSSTENITIYELDEIIIFTILETNQGVLELLINDELIQKSIVNNTLNTSINLSKEFVDVGIYEIKARYNETENYTNKEIIIYIEVKEKLIISNIQENYNIGDDAFYLIHAPINSEVQIEIWWNDTNNPGFEIRELQETIIVDELNINLNNILWKKISLSKTKKVGNYRFVAKLKNTNIDRVIKYVVLNSMKLSVLGETKLETGKETTLTAKATFGVEPYTYTWTLPDETTRTGSELKIKFDDVGKKNIKVVARDKEGNKQEKTISLDINKYHDLTIEVRDFENKVLKDAEVEISDLKESKFTDAHGKVKFRIPTDKYKINIYEDNHAIKTENIDLNKDTSFTIKLNKKETTQSTSTTDKIIIQTPINQATINTNDVKFEAKISLESRQTCKLLVANKDAQWLVELSRKENVQEENIVFNEKLDVGSYKWQISCGNEESQIRELTINLNNVATTNFDKTIDAGELRRQIENAHTNLDNLNLNARRAADALDVGELLRISLRDYERILRDINSLSMRRDLSNEQKEEKLYEYRDLIGELEKTTPLLIELYDSEEFIIYPDAEEIELIANAYSNKRNIQGRLDKKELESLQNLIRVRTYVALVKITYLNGDNKDITLIHKNVEYTGEQTQNQFILEKIPDVINGDVIILQTHDSLIKNELIRFEKPETFTYYLLGHKELEDTKKAHTILLSESVFSSSSSSSKIPSFTGFATISGSDLDATSSLILLLVLLILAYLFYLFDLKNKIFNLFAGMRKDKKLKEFELLINDAKDYLDSQNLERANLIYKELKLLYEKSPKLIKNHVYKDITELVKVLNEKYLEYLITRTHDYIKNHDLNNAIKLYNKLTDAFNKSELDTQKTFKEQILKLNEDIKKSKN